MMRGGKIFPSLRIFIGNRSVETSGDINRDDVHSAVKVHLAVQ